MDINQIKQNFIMPSVAYRGKPFWSWNGELRGEELVRQAHIMKEMGLGGYFMHSRAGLITEYLGDEWFELINEVADAAEADGMEAWLYDEDRWPSGSAGGKVTVDPQYRMKGLFVFESDPDRVEWDENSISLFVGKLDGINLYTYKQLDVSSVKCGECAKKLVNDAIKELEETAAGDPGAWKAMRYAIVPDSPSSNYNGTTYADTMSLKATQKFIELTHEQYLKRCGDRIGTSVKGIFTDEPHRGSCFGNRVVNDGVMSCSICYTDDIFDEFEKRYGFDARPILPELFYRKNADPVAPVKLHYIDLADHLFIERFAKPINQWCEEHGMILTGHVLHENSLMNQTAPHGSIMRFYEHMGYPGVDVLGERGREYWIVKQLTSVARQLGKKWLLSELYGCTGWKFDFKAHKAVGDWQALFGINVRCPHLSWYTMEGESKRDYPASILHQSPWYKDYSKIENYFARMGLVLSEGKPSCDVLMLNPIESLWCQAYVGWARWIFNASEDIKVYEENYVKLFHFLTGNHIDFDYGEEEMMSRMASVEVENGEAVLKVGLAAYKTVVVSDMLTIRPTTLSLLREFADKGGHVIFAGDVPAYVDAVKSDEPARLAEDCITVPFDEKALVDAIRKNGSEYVSITDKDGNADRSVFVQVRRDFGGDGYGIVVLNTDRNEPHKDLTLSIKAQGGYSVQLWDLESGERYDASAMASEENGFVRIGFDLEAAGTICYVLTKQKEAFEPAIKYVTEEENTLVGEFDYACDEKNVCVLDFCKWRFKDGPWHDVAEALKADRQIRDEVGIEHRGGEMLQPWFAKLHDRKVYGELELSYEFFIEKMPSGEVILAGERPELNHYSINGVKLENTDINDFWIDDCFKRMKIPADALRLGRNEVTVKVSFKRTTNVEALYLVGDFGVLVDCRSRTLTDLPEKMGCVSYADYAMPFYTGNMTFELTYEDYKDVLKESAADADRIVLTPKKFTGACVKVAAAGKTQILAWDPYEADVTEAFRQKLPIYVTVVGLRANVFGPLHQTPNHVGSCGPGNFVTSGDRWTDDYSLLDSGLRGFAFKAQKKL